MSPLVSVIIPVYNAVKYIGKTLDSILAQTYDNYEVILIVDGATDGSYEICKTYAASDERITLIYQLNKGISESRNRGIYESKGKYILFVDHDDDILPELMERVVSSAEDSGADLVKFGFTILNIGANNYCCKKMQLYKDVIYDISNLYDNYMYLLKNEANVYVWDALYRSDFIKTNSLYFDKKYRNGGEDIAFNISMLPYIKKIRFIHDNFYNHYNREKQSVSLKYSENSFKSKIWQLDEAQKIYKECFSIEEYPKCYAYFVSKLIGSVCTKGIYMDETEISVKYLQIIRKHVKWDTVRKVYKEYRFSGRRKITLILNELGMNKIILFCFQLNSLRS